MEGFFQVGVAGEDEVGKAKVGVFDDAVSNLGIRTNQRRAGTAADKTHTSPDVGIDFQVTRGGLIRKAIAATVQCRHPALAF